MKKILYILLTALTLISCRKMDHSSGKINVIATIFPLYDFAKETGKDKINVSMILPPGAEAHSYEPTPIDIVKINECSIFIYIGNNMEPWAVDLMKSINNKNLKVIEAGKASEMISESDAPKISGALKDPHIWLDFDIDKKIIDMIASKLCEIDKPNSSYYLLNAENYKNKLTNLDNNYREAINDCELKTVMYGGHFAFGYMAKKYGLTYMSPYEGFTPDSEPTPQKIVQLIENINKNKIEYLFYEELLDPKVAKAVSKETGVKLELLHGAHNMTKEEMESNITFIDIMDQNLVKLKKSLHYK